MDDSRMMGHMFDRNVSSNKHESASVFPLPLNLIALIISYLDQSSDLARMCRTCRVFHYMTLPQLYANVSLRSYDYIRYSERDGRPQGCGMASPFSMGLNGLVSRNVAGYVKSFEVCGEWKEYELQEHARVGRVPDGSMMLSCLVRVAVEKMAVLDSFSWQLSTKMLPTVWQGLAQKSTLTKLTVKFPSNRHPRPITVVPPIPSLQYLKITDIDPLCYADDISSLLLGSKNIRDLKLHWSPRMREAREPSVHQATYFGKVAAAHYQIPIRTIAIANLYTHHDHSSCHDIFDNSGLQEVSFINSTGGLGDDGSNGFMDEPNWRKPQNQTQPKLKMLRFDKVSRQQCEFLSNFTGLERIYIIGPQITSKTHGSRDQQRSNSNTPLPHSPPSTSSSPSITESSNIVALKDDYIEAITKNHGSTLRHLLLLPQWRLTDDDVAVIVRQCPNLEQLGIGAEFGNFKNLRLLVPFLSKLNALRLLGSPDDATFANKMRELDEQGMHEEKIGEETVNREWSKLRWMELGGDDLIFEIGRREFHEREGKGFWKRRVKKRPWEDVKDIDIWAMDSLEI